MRHLQRIRLATLALVLAFAAAQAQEPAPGNAAAHDELRVLQARMEEALNKGDLDGLLAHVDEEVVFTAMNAAVGRGKQGIRDYFNQMMVGPDRIVQSVSIDLVPDKLSTFHGPDTAIAAGSAPSRFVLTNGLDFEVDGRWTATLVRKQGRWLVATFHFSTDVFNNPVLDLQRMVLLIGGGLVALLMAVLGFFIGRRAGRKAILPG